MGRGEEVRKAAISVLLPGGEGCNFGVDGARTSRGSAAVLASRAAETGAGWDGRAAGRRMGRSGRCVLLGPLTAVLPARRSGRRMDFHFGHRASGGGGGAEGEQGRHGHPDELAAMAIQVGFRVSLASFD
eukprot:scaffold1850_cov194-Pinguiococcus_pyrenoidosus.AAC.11